MLAFVVAVCSFVLLFFRVLTFFLLLGGVGDPGYHCIGTFRRDMMTRIAKDIDTAIGIAQMDVLQNRLQTLEGSMATQMQEMRETQLQILDRLGNGRT